MTKFLFLFAFSFVFSTFTQAQNFWKKTEIKEQHLDTSKNKEVYQLNLDLLNKQLENAPTRNSGQKPIIVYIPTLDGRTERFAIYKSSVIDENLEKKFNLYSFVGIGLDNNKKYIRFSISQKKFNSITINEKGIQEFIDPIPGKQNAYKVKSKTRRSKKDFLCNTPSEKNAELAEYSEKFQPLSNSQKLKIFRLAISTTGEYTELFGGIAGALEQINITITRVNAVMERDLGVNLKVIDNTDIIFTDPRTDPYDDSDYMNFWNDQLQNTLTRIVGEENYDIGHLFGASGGGGNAGCIGCVCINGIKGSGFTSPSITDQPFGDEFDIDFVAHELGHQLGANHTFSFVLEGGDFSHPLGLANREPGSGSTIMSYAGITGSSDVQAHSDDYFHEYSIFQISKNLENKNCGTETLINNNPPVAKAKAKSIVVPIGTRFYLDGSDSFDPDGDPISFTWEQNDIPKSQVRSVSSQQTSGPIFRSTAPNSNPKRYFPALKNNLYDSKNWETASIVPRTLNFRLTVRDNSVNGPQTNFDDQEVVISDAGGPFIIKKPQALDFFEKGEEILVEWEVANTHISPFNVENVRISLLNEQEEIIPLLEKTPNNGSALVKLPENYSSKNSKIIIEALEKPFLAVSEEFAIGYKIIKECNEYNYTGQAVTIPDRDSYIGIASLKIEVPHFAVEEGSNLNIKTSVGITHDDISDLVVVLQAPDSKSIMLWENNCYNPWGLNTDIQAIFSDDGEEVDCENITNGNLIKPEEPIESLYNSPLSGIWTLYAIDHFRSNSGSLHSFSISICSTKYEEIKDGERIDDDPVNNKPKVGVYPIPSSGKFNFAWEEEQINGEVVVKVYNSSGALVYNNKTKQNNFEIDLLGYPAGIYYAHIKVNGKTVKKPLLIVK